MLAFGDKSLGIGSREAVIDAAMREIQSPLRERPAFDFELARRPDVRVDHLAGGACSSQAAESLGSRADGLPSSNRCRISLTVKRTGPGPGGGQLLETPSS